MLVPCRPCHGQGRRATALGDLLPCPECEGRGRLDRDEAATIELGPCPVCKGDGRMASYLPDEACPCCLGFGDIPITGAEPEDVDRAA